MGTWSPGAEVDEISDHLDYAAALFRMRSREIQRELENLTSTFNDEILAATDWARKVGLIEEDDWTDEVGEPFLPVAVLKVDISPVPDVATMFRERVTTLRGGAHD